MPTISGKLPRPAGKGGMVPIKGSSTTDPPWKTLSTVTDGGVGPPGMKLFTRIACCKKPAPSKGAWPSQATVTLPFEETAMRVPISKKSKGIDKSPDTKHRESTTRGVGSKVFPPSVEDITSTLVLPKHSAASGKAVITTWV